MRTLLFCLFLVPFTVFGQKMRTDLQEELAKVLQQSIRDAGQQNLLGSVTKVNVTVD